MKLEKLFAGASIVALLMGGCAPYPIHMDADKPLLKGTVVGEDLSNRLIITGIKDTHGVASIKAGELAQTELRRNLLSNGIDLANIERSVMDNLVKEVELIELQGGVSQYSLPSAADFAINGEITSVTAGASHTPAMRLKDGSYTKPFCTYSARVEGILLMYKVNPVEKAATIPIAGAASTKTIGGYCNAYTVRTAYAAASATSLVRQAINNAIDGANAKILNRAAPKGKVLSAKIDAKGKTVHYRISISPQQGATPGTTVQFLQTFENSFVPFAKGKISCTTHKEAAYVKVTRPEDIDRIKLNTPVRLNFSNFDLGKQMGSTIPCN